MGKTSDALNLDRYRSWARAHVSPRYDYDEKTDGDTTITPTRSNTNKSNTETGGLDKKQDGRGSPSGSTSNRLQHGGGQHGTPGSGGGGGDNSGGPEAPTRNDNEDAISKAAPPPAPPPNKSENEGSGNPPVTTTDAPQEKPTIGKRMMAGIMRFFIHMKDALFYSWVNVLLVFVPIGIAVEAVGLSPGIIFGMNAIAIVPLAGLLAHATEAVAARLGDTLGALLNVSFGNAVELIIFIIALVKNEISIVQASLLGSILANLLLILGMAFLFGGLRFREQIYNSTVTQMSACLLSLSVTSLLLPVSASRRPNSISNLLTRCF